MMKLNEIRLSASVALIGAGALAIAGTPLGLASREPWYHAFSYVVLTIALCLVAAMVPRHAIMLGLYGVIATAAGVAGALSLWSAGIGGGTLVPERWVEIVSLTLLVAAPVVFLASLLSPHPRGDAVTYVALIGACASFGAIVGGETTVLWLELAGVLLVAAGLACGLGLRRTTSKSAAHPTVALS